MKIWAYPPPYQSGVGLSGTLSTPLSLRYVQTTPTIPYARDEQSRGRKTNNHGVCQRTMIFNLNRLTFLKCPTNKLPHKRRHFQYSLKVPLLRFLLLFAMLLPLQAVFLKRFGCIFGKLRAKKVFQNNPLRFSVFLLMLYLFFL